MRLSRTVKTGTLIRREFGKGLRNMGPVMAMHMHGGVGMRMSLGQGIILGRGLGLKKRIRVRSFRRSILLGGLLSPNGRDCVICNSDR